MRPKKFLGNSVHTRIRGNKKIQFIRFGGSYSMNYDDMISDTMDFYNHIRKTRSRKYYRKGFFKLKKLLGDEDTFGFNEYQNIFFINEIKNEMHLKRVKKKISLGL